MPSAISLNTSIEDLHNFKIARLGQILSHKLAKALASQVHKKSSAAVTVEDLLNYFPMRYEDRSRPALIKDLKEGVEASLELTVTRTNGYAVRNPRGYGRSSLYIFEVYGIDGPMTGKEVIVWWFVSGRRAYDIVKYYSAKLERGTRFVTFGRWEWEGRRSTFKLRLNNAADELEIVSPTTSDDPEQSEENQPDPALAAVHVGRRVPVYRKLGEFNSKRVREIVHAVLSLLSDKAIEETLPADLRHRARLIGRAQAVREIHFPPPNVSMDDYEQSKSPAHLRMIFEDFFWVTFAIGFKRGQREKEVKAMPLRIDKAVKTHIASVMPFTLTNAQRKVTAQIFKDMQSRAPMNRLLQGDVGSGKTIVALVAMLAAMENDLQTAMMAPTEILAEQHARSIKRLLARTPYRVELLTGSVRAAEKRRLQNALKQGEIHACIGTQALIQEAVAFEKLGLVVIDEQHRFGVMQRAELRAR
ncbi:MAG TPA: DEAD/DEAH box helicase, partial [Pyrinomonadaceae bacterium]|nr:DEAD/DEAH box helicase [Pyrinomonadaceae bacterium]